MSRNATTAASARDSAFPPSAAGAHASIQPSPLSSKSGARQPVSRMNSTGGIFLRSAASTPRSSRKSPWGGGGGEGSGYEGGGGEDALGRRGTTTGRTPGRIAARRLHQGVSKVKRVVGGR